MATTMASASGGMDYSSSDRGSRYRDLEINGYPELQAKNKKRKNNGHHLIDPKTGLQITDKDLPEFFIVKRIDNDNKSFATVSPFFIEKALTQQIGQQHETKRLRDGTLLVKCINDKQSKSLLKFNNMLFGNSYKVEVTEHATLNTVQGVVFCWDAKFLTEDEILEGLTDQKVIKVQKIKKKVRGELVDTALCILTFKRFQLPTSIKFGFHSVLVKTYIPNPMRCLNCFLYGHTRKNCKNDRICDQCSMVFHEPVACTTDKFCVNCNGSHDNFDKECPRFKREIAIQKIKVQDKISYIEARRKLDSFHPLPQNTHTITQTQSESFAHVVSKNSLTEHARSRSNSNTKKKSTDSSNSHTVIVHTHKTNPKSPTRKIENNTNTITKASDNQHFDTNNTLKSLNSKFNDTHKDNQPITEIKNNDNLITPTTDNIPNKNTSNNINKRFKLSLNPPLTDTSPNVMDTNDIDSPRDSDDEMHL